MKRIVALIVTFLLIFTIAYAEPPIPSVYSNPACEYYIPDNMVEVYMNVRPQLKDFEDYTLRGAFYTLVLPYNTIVIWHFSTPYLEKDEVYLVLVNEEYEITNILHGYPLPDCTVLFDFSEVEGGVYYFFELSKISI